MLRLRYDNDNYSTTTASPMPLPRPPCPPTRPIQHFSPPVLVLISPVTFQGKKKLSTVLFDLFTAPTTPPSLFVPIRVPPAHSRHPHPFVCPPCSFTRSLSICGSGDPLRDDDDSATSSVIPCLCHHHSYHPPVSTTAHCDARNVNDAPMPQR